MAKRLLFIIALGSTLAVIGAATASSLSVGGVDVTTPTLPLPTTPTTSNPLPSSPLPDTQLPSVGGGGSSGGGSTSGSSTSGSSTSGSSTSGSSTSGSSTSGSGSTTTTTSGGGGTAGGGSGTKKHKGLFAKKKNQRSKQVVMDKQNKITQPVLRNPNGTPTPQNPGLTLAQFGPAPIGVPNPVIDSFEIPPFLLPIYQSCGTEYGIPWQVLASINKIETAFGTNLNVSSAGAMGWMQFIPSTWAAYGVDANEDGRKDPYNPVDAICAAARYLSAAGGDHDIRQAIFAYNHADWYVDEVLLGANQYGRLPDALVGSLTGLTEGAHFPVAADARYADDINDAAALARSTTQRKAAGNAADVISSDASRRSINIYSSLNAPVVAVNDGVIKKMGNSKELGKFIVLQDAYGNRYTYSQLGADLPSPSGAPPAEARRRAPSSSRGRTRTRPRRARRPRVTTRHAGRRAPANRRSRGPAPPPAQRVPATPRGAASASSPSRSGSERRPAELSGRGISCRRSRCPPRPDRARSPDLPVRPEDNAAEAAQGRLPGDWRFGDRADRQVPSRPAAAQLRDPPGGARRPDDRPEADPRRLEAARDHRDLPG